ncbi:MAG: hypothetical protein M1816_000756 [Peltula sp. TS41687]|nr:MAG: hypothetical protein M1816_000756 [Peltula sp. TS41687]
MSRGNNDEQFKFLISCIRHANNSKVDFAAVAKECGIVSKGAAAKRYERMMKAHGIATNTPAARTTPAPSASRRENSTPSKKRKLSNFAADAEGNAVDDDEGQVGVKEECGSDGVDGIHIKGENDVGINLDENAMSSFVDPNALNEGLSIGGIGGIGDGGNEDELQELPLGSMNPVFHRLQFGGDVMGSGRNSEGTGVGMSESIVISD